MNADLSSLEKRLELLENAGIANLRSAQLTEASRGTDWTAEQIKEFIEAILDEKDRALHMADAEREKAAAALRNEQQRAIDRAAEEREKAASNLRVELARSIDEGDARLREHIMNQVSQIQSALVAATRASDKFEETVKARFTQVNEFRAALDDLGKQMATRRELETAIVNLAENIEKARIERQRSIEELQQALQEMRSRLDTGTDLRHLQTRIDLGEGRNQGTKATWGNVAAMIGVAATGLGILVVLANVLTN